jgi:hypothetical protein
VLYHLNINFHSVPTKAKTLPLMKAWVWKGRLSIKQYLPLKTSKFGIQTFELCESRIGYLWRFLVCTGKKNTVLQSSLITPNTPQKKQV